MQRLRESAEWQFFGVLGKAGGVLAATWWGLIVLRGALPAAFALAMGSLISAVQHDGSLVGPLAAAGIIFVALQVLSPLHGDVGANLGAKTGAWLNDRLMEACISPPGLAHLERPDLNDDLTLARDFDLGISGPPLSVCISFIGNGFVEIAGGIAQALVLFGYRWWAPLVVGGAWASTHVLLKESGVWRARQTPAVMEEQRHADYAYRLAVDPPAAKEIRLFGLADWTVGRFASRRRRLLDLTWEAIRLRQRSVIWSLSLILAGNGLLFWSLANDASAGRIGLGALVVFAQTAIGTSALAFGGFDWWLRTARRPAGSAGAPPRQTHARQRRLDRRNPRRRWPAGGRDPLSRCALRL